MEQHGIFNALNIISQTHGYETYRKRSSIWEKVQSSYKTGILYNIIVCHNWKQCENLNISSPLSVQQLKTFKVFIIETDITLRINSDVNEACFRHSTFGDYILNEILANYTTEERMKLNIFDTRKGGSFDEFLLNIDALVVKK